MQGLLSFFFFKLLFHCNCCIGKEHTQVRQHPQCVFHVNFISSSSFHQQRGVSWIIDDYVCVSSPFSNLDSPLWGFVCRDGTTMSTKLLLLVVMIVLCSSEQTHLILFFWVTHVLSPSFGLTIMHIVSPFTWSLCTCMKWWGRCQKAQSSWCWSSLFSFILVSNLAWSPSFGHAWVCHCFLMAFSLFFVW